MASTKKQVIIAGATGLIGKELVSSLTNLNYNVLVLTRDAERFLKSNKNSLVSCIEWQGIFTTWLVREVENSIAIINLAGENIADRPWTRRRRMQLIRSRLGTTRTLAKACHYAKKKPEVFLQASAIGYYPLVDNKVFDEKSERGNGFLARLTADWESVAIHELPQGIRLVLLRSGVVLSRKGGMLPKLVIPVKFFVGGWFGSGKQQTPWIHIADEINAIIHLTQNVKAEGPFNLVAPESVSQKVMVKRIARKLGGLAWIPIPSIFVRFALGQMADEMLLKGIKVDSSKLKKQGFEFSFPTLDMAFDDLLK
jgi:uncharacterized protein